MDHAVIINQRQQRNDADKLNRSDALNRTLTGHEQTIQALRSELFATRIATAIAISAMFAAMLYVLRGGV
ncbi:MAG: hypothetical protein WCS28_12360 [Thiomicrospira sp.]|jgi:hypothetical protein